MHSPLIRPATVADCGLILQFIRDLAEYERALDAVEATESHLRETLFCANPRVHAVIAEYEGEAAGFAVFFFNYSTWLGRHGLFLEDLFVHPSRRGHGIGKALLHHLAQRAVAENCGRMEWNVLDWNTPAISFYQSLGAKPQDEWIGYRLSGEALQQFAANSG